jgi:iron complex transport system ATP-binding protein
MAGKNISRLSVSDMAKVVSYVPQEHAPPFPYLVEDIVLMGRSPHLRGVFGVSRKDRIKASDALSVVGMTEMARRPYTHLSGGQRQLVLMARAMAQETPVMFLDEPTSALDFSNQVRIWKLMREIVDGGVTILACSHDPNHVAWFCDDVVVMGSEGIMASGHPRDVITNATLGALYEESCSLSHAHGVPIVVPCSIHTHGGRQQ